MLVLIIILIFMVIFVMFYSLLRIAFKGKLALAKRMDYVDNIERVQTETKEITFSNRAIVPMYNWVGGLLLKFSPSWKLSKLKSRLAQGGLLKKTSPEKWIANKLIFTLIALIVTAMIIGMIDFNVYKIASILALELVLVNSSFRFYVSKLIAKKKRSITKDLPYILDLITVSVEAGLSLDGAVARIVNSIEGPLSDEFAQALKEMKMGILKKNALKNMSERCKVKELSMLLTSLIQADELGVSLGKILRIEGAQMREKQKQTAREKAMKAPVKMLFPLIFFIFPAIFVIILGPAIIKVSEIF